jgi:hypothetical protein
VSEGSGERITCSLSPDGLVELTIDGQQFRITPEQAADLENLLGVWSKSALLDDEE